MSNLLGREPFPEANVLVQAYKNSLDAVQIDRIDGVVYYVNAAWESLFEEIPSDSLDVAREQLSYADADISSLDRSWITCLESGSATGSILFSTPHHALKRLSFTRTLCTDVSSNPIAILTVFRIVSGEEVGTYISDFLTQVVPSNEGSIAFLEPTGHVIAANLSFALTVGVNKSDTFGQHIEQFINNGRDIIERADKTYAGLTEVAQVMRPTGAVLETTVSVRRVKDDSGVTLGFIVRIRAT